jgi:hypothetical protein
MGFCGCNIRYVRKIHLLLSESARNGGFRKRREKLNFFDLVSASCLNYSRFPKNVKGKILRKFNLAFYPLDYGGNSGYT